MSNEITVKLNENVNQVAKILEEKNFELKEKFIVDDTFYVPKNLSLEKLNVRQILANAVLLREITGNIDTEKPTKIKKLTFKNKEIDEQGNILKQEKTDCHIFNVEEGKKFLEAIGYKELMRIEETDLLYTKDGLYLGLKQVDGMQDMMEAEVNEGNPKINTIEKIKKEVNKLGLPIDTSDYFVKKAEIRLQKVLKEAEMGER